MSEPNRQDAQSDSEANPGPGEDEALIQHSEVTPPRDHGTTELSVEDVNFTAVLRAATGYAIIGTDLQGTVTFFNDGAERMLGYSAVEVIGRLTALTFHDPDEIAARAAELGVSPGRDVFLRSARCGEAETRAWTYVRKDGTRLTVLLSVSAICDDARNVRGFIGIARDITEHRRIDEELRRLSQWHESILNAAGEGIYGLDREGTARFINPAVARMLGFEVEELIGRSLHALVHHSKPDGSPYPSDECPVFGALRDGAVHHVTGEVFWRKDGTSFPVEYVSTPIREDGQVTGAVVIIKDVTERKRAEAEHARLLRQAEAAEERFRGLFESAPDAIVIADPDGRIVLVNRRAEEVFGYARDELLGKPVEVLLPERFREEHVHYRTAYVSERRPPPICNGPQFSGLRKDGSVFPVEISLSISNSDQNVLVTAIIRDVTERKTAEEERDRLLAREQAARAQAEEAARVIGRLQAVTDTALAHLALEDLLQELLARISEVLAVETAVVLLLDDDNTLVTRATRGLDDDIDNPIRIPVGKGFAGRVAAERRALVVEDVDHLEILNSHLLKKGPRSLLGVPLLIEGRVIGVLHVGTTRTRRFVEDDARLLELVADRVAMAVDRARLFEAQRSARATAEEAQRRVEFLAEASAILASSLDYQTTLANIARLAVPALADACLVDIVEDGMLRLVAVAHADPQKETLLEELRRRHPIDPDSPYGVAKVLRTGQPEIVTIPGDDWFATIAQNAEHLNLLRRLAVTSYLTVPLQARGRMIGTISLVSTRTDHHYQASDRAFAEDLAGRCALAVDNSLLMRESQRGLEREHAARAEAERLAVERTTILGKIADGVVIANPNGRVVYLNEAAQRLLNTSDRSSATDRILNLDHPFAGLLSEEDRPLSEDELPIVRAALHGDTVIGTEMRIQTASGQETVFEGSATPVVGDGGIRLGAVMTLHDVTAQRNLERQKDEFLANVSHDLRTPLTAIKASIGVVLANEPPGTPEPLHRMFVNIQLAADRMAVLVSDLLELTRLQAKRVQFQPVHCDLLDIARRSARSIEPLSQARGQHLEVRLPREPVPALVDPDRLERALLNVLGNAQKYGPPGGTILFSVESDSSEALFSVSDNGPGISEEEQKHIFERFYRSETEAIHRNQGSGLGLPIAKAVVELHGGRIWVESTPGSGATFRIKVPLEPRPISVGQEDGIR